jgi:hypothetical protein
MNCARRLSPRTGAGNKIARTINEPGAMLARALGLTPPKKTHKRHRDTYFDLN